MSDIYEILDGLEIDYVRYDHPAVFTVEEAEEHRVEMNGAHTKNLFIRNKKGDRHYLVTVPAEKRVDIKTLQAMLNESKLSFASPERLLEHLGLTPGSVSLLGLVNNTRKDVVVIIDSELWQNERICCHPNINTATLELSREGLEKYFKHCGNEVRYLDLQ